MTPGEIRFENVHHYARQLLEAQLTAPPWFAEVPPFTVAGLLMDDPENPGGDQIPLQIETVEELVEAKEKAINSIGFYGEVLEPIDGRNMEGGLIDTGISIGLVENIQVNRNEAGGVGIPAVEMIRHVKATLLRFPGGSDRGLAKRGYPEFRLAENTFYRLDTHAGLLNYAVNFRINVLLK